MSFSIHKQCNRTALLKSVNTLDPDCIKSAHDAFHNDDGAALCDALKLSCANCLADGTLPSDIRLRKGVDGFYVMHKNGKPLGGMEEDCFVCIGDPHMYSLTSAVEHDWGFSSFRTVIQQFELICELVERERERPSFDYSSDDVPTLRREESPSSQLPGPDWVGEEGL